jgi:hypothetical protein
LTTLAELCEKAGITQEELDSIPEPEVIGDRLIFPEYFVRGFKSQAEFDGFNRFAEDFERQVYESLGQTPPPPIRRFDESGKEVN